ncbi:uncharacterized protein ISCGN_001534, partial [Ixodes scapularis]
MATLGRIEPFDEAGTDWPTYIERLDQFFVANDVKPERQVAAFLSLIGAKTYALLKSLVAPDIPASKSYIELVAILREHLSPKPLVIAERFRFHKRNQNENESILEFVAELKKLAQTCEFGGTLNEALRDRMVCGIISDSIQKRLLSEAGLTFKKALEIAVAMEAAFANAQVLHCRSADAEVLKVDQDKSECKHCGLTNHTAINCRWKGLDCRRCGRRGHLERVCRSQQSGPAASQHRGAPTRGRRNKGEKVKTLNVDTEDEVEMFELRGTRPRPLQVTVKVNTIPLTMEVDTGAAVSVLPLDLYKTRFPNLVKGRSGVVLRAFTGKKVKPVGEAQVEVEYQDQVHKLPLQIVDFKGPPLLGRDWLEVLRLDWTSIKAVQCLEKGSKEQVDTLLKDFAQVFSDDLGRLQGFEAHLKLKSGHTPKFLKPRPVPHALKEAVSKELMALKEAGILTPVDSSEFASPIVPVVKKNGDIRICGDYKSTINPCLEVDNYPLPRIEEMFATLAEGKFFSKLDLSKAYLQLEMHPAARKYLTINTQLGLFQVNRLPFGIASAPSIFQRTMDQVLQGLPQTTCYLDDILVTGRTKENPRPNDRDPYNDSSEAPEVGLSASSTPLHHRPPVFRGKCQCRLLVKTPKSNGQPQHRRRRRNVRLLL